MEVINNHYLFLLLIFPLIGAFLSFICGRYKASLAGWIATLFSSLTAVLAILLLFKLKANTAFEQVLFQWLNVDWVQVSISLSFDNLTAIMVAFVTVVTSLIHLYAIGYMKDDIGQGRFFSYFNLFLFFMLLLLLASNLAVFFIGWEGVGLISYLLIGFEFQKEECAIAGRKAFLVNRIGDAGFLVGMLFLFFYVGSLDFSKLQAFNYSNIALTFVGFCLLLGAVGKSAQLPLFVWLPDAMLGPTPVSALIHAATMVTAGVYLLVRCAYLFTAPQVEITILILSFTTILLGGLAALFQSNFKKVLAYSTISQLGLMFLISTVGAYSLAILHIVMHAFFKACLFLVAGIVIKATSDSQDFSKLGGLWRKTPIAFIAYLLATFSIIGLYPFSGFYSKHAIFEALENNFNGKYFLSLLILSAILTTCYMTRSLFLVFFGKCKNENQIKKTPLLMSIPVCVLALLATFAGWMWGENIFNFLSSYSSSSYNYFNSSIVSSIISSWSAWGVSLICLGMFCFADKILNKLTQIFKPIVNLCANGFYIDKFYLNCLVPLFVSIAKFINNVIEKYLIDGVVEGVASFTIRAGKSLAKYFEKYVIDGFVEGNAKLAVLNGKLLSLLQCGQVGFYALLVFVTLFVSVMYLVF